MLNGQIIKFFQVKDKAPDPFFLHCTEDFDRHVREQMNQRPRPEENQIVFQAEGEPAFSVARGECLVMQDLDNCMIQELPVHSMLFSNLSYLDNPCFTLDHRVRGVWGSKRVKKSLRQEYAELLGEEVFDLPVDRLTEWQKYDLIYTRIYLQNPKVVFCVQPFKSAEVALRIHIMELLERFLNKGIPVVIMAVNLADSLALADRLLRVRRGGKVQEYHRDEFAALPVNTPWLYLYQEKYREEW